MLSDYALSQIHALERRGLHPTAEDVIRLNAFGLAIDAAAGKRVRESLFHLPRIAILKKGVFLRQPTIGHEIWIRTVVEFVDDSDPLTILAVNCFALSRPPSDLPDPSDPESVKLAIDGFCETFADFTRDQLYLAYDWVRFGMDAASCELAANLPEHPDEGGSGIPSASEPKYDSATCVALGMLYNGAAILWGLSLAEIRGMTQDQLRLTIRRASKQQHVELEDGVIDAEDEFNEVLYEITTRLEAEAAQKT